jgi:alanyl-tRNA synthetase
MGGIEGLGLDPKRLYVSVYEGNPSIGVPKDEESIAIWQELFKEKGMEAKIGERIFMYGDTKNWWSRSGEPQFMPVGEPGGPDSEVFFDFDPDGKYKFHENSPFKNEKCHPNCDCGRFLEIGNSVFMQYKKTETGFVELTKKCVDFGGGLERITAAVNGRPDVFQTDLFLPIIEEIEKISHKKYSEEKNARLMRIIVDHLRASVFLIADGVYPSNKLQGYFLRRLLRRAMLYGNKLGFEINGEVLARVTLEVFAIYKDSPFSSELQTKKEQIVKVINEEGNKFSKSLSRGLKEIEKIENLDGKTAFKIYETYGFPMELLEEIASQKKQTIDKKVFEGEFKKHQELSRTSSAGMFKGGLADSSAEVTRLHTATHLLHQALRTILGNTISQKGSNITKERLRFDFSFDRKIEPEELKKVENLVNEQIKKELPVVMKITTLTEAKKEGALAFFGEKYGEKVKVYTIGPSTSSGFPFSKEVCGGPHVENTKELDKFSIIKEESAGSGVRRVYAKL